MSVYLKNVGIGTFPQWQLHPLNSADERACRTICAEAGLRVTRVTLCSLQDADNEPLKNIRPSLELKRPQRPNLPLLSLKWQWRLSISPALSLPGSLLLLPVCYSWLPRGRMWPLAPGIYLGKRDAPCHCLSWLCRRSAALLSLLSGSPAAIFNGSDSTKLWLHHTSSHKEKQLRQQAPLFFICPSLVERIRFLFLCLQVQINSLKPSGRRTPMTRLHFRSPHNCFGQGILNGLLSFGTQLTKLQNLFQKWLAQTLSNSGIPCPRPQTPCPIAGPGPGINYWLFSRQQHIQL